MASFDDVSPQQLDTSQVSFDDASPDLETTPNVPTDSLHPCVRLGDLGLVVKL